VQQVPTRSELLTVGDYRATPEGSRYQLIDGELIMAPAPNRYHQEIVWNLMRILDRHLVQHQTGRAFVAPFDVFLSEHDVFQPDVLFISKDRENILADDGAHGAPDLVIEIISPSNAHLEKTAKRAVYARTGVKEFWLVDPHLQQIHLYDFAANPAKFVRIVDEDETFETATLPGLVVAAAEVFKR
jgi:Uma2 family endonuclease